MRPHWREYLREFRNLSADDLVRGRGQAARLIEENGVTYNVYGDPQGVNRPWALDLVPQILSPEDWAVIEAGLKQRAVLLNLVLSDLYGAQTLVKERRIPPEFVFANPQSLQNPIGIKRRVLDRLAAILAEGIRDVDAAVGALEHPRIRIPGFARFGALEVALPLPGLALVVG